MILRLLRFLAVLTLAIGVSGPLAAQSSATPPAAAPTADQLRGLVQTLQDEPARARLVEQLQALIAAQQTAVPKEELPPTIGSRLLSVAADHLDSVRRYTMGVVTALSDLPGAFAWIRDQAADPIARERWLVFAVQILVILVAGSVAAGVVERLLSRPQRLIVERTPPSWGLKLPFLVLRTVLKLLPIAAFAATAYALLSVSDLPRVRLAVLAIINASILVRLIQLGVGVLIDPQTPKLRLAPLGDEAAGLLSRWTRRFVVVAVYGYFLIEASFVLGLPLAAYGLTMQILGLVLTVILVRLILRSRKPVAEWLRATPLSGDTEEEAPVPASGPITTGRAALMGARRRLAEVWHIVAAAYIAAVYVVWSLNVYGGFEYLAQATVVTLAVVAVARLFVNGALGGLARAYRVPLALTERLERYHPTLVRLIKAAVWLAAALIVLDAWGLNTTRWLSSPAGQRIVGSLVTVFAVLAAAVIAWEGASLLIERLLADIERVDSRTGRTARARTLLPMLRNAFLMVLVTVVGLITLSELGVNIAPLLAGAGVVGLAVGFGSQTLVKDVITGLFILLEDTIAVGDVVDVGGGHSGVVEAMSVRTIRLRDVAGAVHSVPFSAVTTITNMTKDFSFAVFDIQVSYAEDPDRVCQTMTELGHELQHDPAFRHVILAPLEVMGLDRLADSGIVIKARFKTRPIQQWTVAREYNRRLLKRFNELGISIPYPHMQLVAPPPRPTVGDGVGG
jgi:moderate conductance mechanosensitive channel